MAVAYAKLVRGLCELALLLLDALDAAFDGAYKGASSALAAATK
jgi:hypothetical protein